MALQASSIKKLQLLVSGAKQKDELYGNFVEEIVAEIIRAESAKATVGKFNIYNYVEKNDKWRPVMSGVFHDNGKKVASDGAVLVAINEEYPA